MEFRFNVNQIFNQPIVRVNSNLLPTGFRGDRRAALDTATKIAEIINEMGMASAKAQGLSNPVTTAQKLRQSDQYIYLLGDPNQGRNGSVIGLLKVGKKSLYVFDTNGQTQMVNAPCVLDFYVHESRQRSGLGKDLFHTMLQEEQYVPEKMAVDRPSDKLLGFLRKHYGLQKTIPQMNNFVVYDGFFESSKHENNVNSHDNRMHITASPNTALFGPQFINDEQSKRAKIQQQSPSATSIPLIQNSPVGRYAAPRPMCSMAEIIHSTATTATGEPNSEIHDETSTTEPYRAVHAVQIDDELDALNVNIAKLQIQIQPNHENNHHHHHHEIVKHHEDFSNGHHRQIDESKIDEVVDHHQDHLVDEEPIDEPQHIKKPTFFPLSKQHTGLKNISYNVGIAVSPTNKMEFNQEQPESFGVLKINRPIGSQAAGLPSHDNNDTASVTSSAGSAGGGDGFTDQGYFDLKFYHNKLW